MSFTGIAVLDAADKTLSARPMTPPRPSPAAPSPPSPGPVWSVQVVEEPAALVEHVAAWDDLAAAALEANAFYESWMLRPAIRSFGAGARLVFVLVYRTDPARPKDPPRLCGFFPVERQPRYRGLPASALILWKHVHCFLCTPLVRAGQARETLAAFFDWARNHVKGASLVDFQFVTGDGPFQQALVEHLRTQQNLYVVSEAFNRALLRRRENAEMFLTEAMSSGYRKELRRLRKRLGEAGRLESRLLQREQDLQSWLDQFLELEARGWKGRGGQNTAMALHDNEASFMGEVSQEALRRGRLLMPGLFLDGRPIAMTVNFLAGDGGFHFKIAYDENLARFSPGVQLELELIEHAHENPRLRWLDSCAVPDHPMINRLWPERRTIHNVLVSTGRWRGNAFVALLPLLRWLARLWRGRNKTDSTAP